MPAGKASTANQKGVSTRRPTAVIDAAPALPARLARRARRESSSGPSPAGKSFAGAHPASAPDRHGAVTNRQLVS